MTNDCTPRFSTAEAVRIAEAFYSITASAQPLPSERDQNFALRTASGGQYVLKVAKSDEARSVLSFQNLALIHVQARQKDLAIPRILVARNGQDIINVTDATGRCFYVRLLTWVEGDILANVTPHTPLLMSSLGTALAELDFALQDFDHPAIHRELHWDVRHADRALAHLPLLSAHERGMVTQFMRLWEAVDWGRLRLSAIHGDANDYNLLVRGGQVVGFLDFGDMVHSATVCDLAIALAYAMLQKPEPLETAATVVQTYHRRFPLTPAEIDALYALATARLCMSVCYAAHNAQAKAGDAYQQVTSRPAWALLGLLTDIPIERAVETLRASCMQ